MAAGNMRGLLFRLVGSVILLHAVAIAVLTAFHIRERSPLVQRTFTGVWIVLTLIVVLHGLAGIRAARLRSRARRR
jgi:hypothetical protein